MKKLNIGAGNLIIAGYENHDKIKHRSEIDIAFDLNTKPWPVEDSTYEEVRMFDVIEHMDDVIGVINEVWRILKPDGIFHCKACGYKNENFWVDITHKHAFHKKSMDYFDPSTDIGKEYSYYTDKKYQIVEITEDRRHNYFYKMKKIKG
jgi:ubiquinone/menaquinone biosynthesis C-methylase UbiE